MENFADFKYNESETVERNIHRFKGILFKLSELQITVSNAMKCAKLVSSLPSSWEGLKLTWGTKDEATQLPSTLYEMLLSQAVRRGETGSNIGQAEALFSRMRIQKSGYRKNRFNRRFGKSKRSNWNQRQTTQVTNDETVITCYNCGQKGHKKWQCKAKPKKGNVKRANVNNVEALMAQYDDSHITEFLCDSGSSHSIVFDKRWFVAYDKFANAREVRLGGQGTLRAEGIGTVRLAVRNEDRIVTLELKDVLFVKRMRRNLISISKLTDDGFEVTVGAAGMNIRKDNAEILARRVDDLFLIVAEMGKIPHDGECFALDIGKENRGSLSLELAHKTLAHLSKEKVKAILDRENIKYVDDFDACGACLQGKQRRASYRTKPEKARARSAGYVSADLCSVSEKSLGGSKHFLTISDAYSKFRKVYFVKAKDETPDMI